MRMFLAALAVLVASPLAAQNYPELQGRHVLDAAGVIPDDQEQALESRLIGFERETGRQIMVTTVPLLDGYDIKDYANGFFRKVKLGRRDLDDGVLLLIAPTERKTRIEVGRGLEPYLTDAASNHIVQTVLLPHFKRGDFGGGTAAAIGNIIDIVSPDAITRQQEQARLDKIAQQRLAAAVERLFSWALIALSLFAAGFGTYWAVTAKSRRRRREAKAREDAVLRAQAAARANSRREAELARRRADEERIAAAARARARQIANETPAERKRRLAAEAATSAAVAAAERREAEEHRRRQQHAQQQDRMRGREARSERDSTVWTPPSDDSSSSSSDFGGFSGGGGDSGGGGADGGW